MSQSPEVSAQVGTRLLFENEAVEQGLEELKEARAKQADVYQQLEQALNAFYEQLGPVSPAAASVTQA